MQRIRTQSERVSLSGSFDIPNLAALQAELGDDFAQELVAAFSGADSALRVQEKLTEIIAQRLREEEASFGNGDDPVA